MAYNPNIPQASNLISQSQPQILANFQALAPFGEGYVDMPVQAIAPTFAAGHDGIYNLNNPTTTANESYIHVQRVGAGNAPTAIPFTASKLSNTAMLSSTNGWSYLPSGLLIKWGQVAATTASVSITPTATSGGPNFNVVLVAYITGVDTGTAVNFTCGNRTAPNNTSGNFTAFCNNPSATTFINYFVIGA